METIKARVVKVALAPDNISMSFSPQIDKLIEALRCLPSVGPKSAQRMAFHLLSHARDKGLALAEELTMAMKNIGHCEQCHTFTESPLCKICEDPRRNLEQLCIVESPIDVLALEQTHAFSGLYYVLLGHLSPLDGIGPKELGLDKLSRRIEHSKITEVICATNPTVEGEATAHYIANLLAPFKLNISRIAHGVPLGSELEFIDGGTLTRALDSREMIAVD